MSKVSSMNRTIRLSAFSICAIGFMATVMPASVWASDSAQSKSQDTQYTMEARKRLPWAGTLGVYIPNFDLAGHTKNTGAQASISYTWPMEVVDLRVATRGTSYSVKGFGKTFDVTTSEIGVDALYRMQAFYAGVGIGLAQGSVSNGGSISNSSIFSVTVGYDINPRWFAEARWQTSSEDGYKGYSISAGYRF